MNADIPPERPVRRYRRGRAHRLENTVTSALVRLGLIPHSYLLTTRGRRTGRPRSNPVTVVEHDGHRWLVAPYGAVPWVHNGDHPQDDLAAGRYRVSMPAAIEAFVQARLHAARRIELCHTERQIVVRQGWQPIAEGCRPADGDRVIPLEG